MRPETPREFVLPTPEGVELHFQLAPVGDRALAFLVDFVVVAVSVLLLWLGVLLLAPELGASHLAVLVVLSFLIRHFYFAVAEIRGRGSSLGKRLRGLRVVDAAGGPLDARAILLRNLFRELDAFVPLLVLPALPWIWPDAPRWIAVLVLVWMVVLLLFPLFDSRRRRLGDLVAGTVVLSVPRRQLLADLADESPTGDQTTPQDEYRFSEAQLAAYGIYELQVLENVLRQDDPVIGMQARGAVSNAIRDRIGWDRGPVRNKAFLSAFYRALRADLERRMLLGDRREDKHAGRDT